MITALTVLQILVAVILIGVVLIQEPKSTGGGLFSGTSQSLLGTSGKNFWTKFTTTLAAVFFLLCLGLATIPRRQGTGSSVADEIQHQQESAARAAAQAQAPAPVGAPGAATSVQQSVPIKFQKYGSSAAVTAPVHTSAGAPQAPAKAPAGAP